MTVFISLLVIILAVLAVVGVHEYGHFIVARWCGVGVRKFAIGFGPALWSRRSPKTGIEYTINCLPLGGYVKLFDSREGPLSDSERAVSFDNQAIYKRVLVIFAGPGMNFVFALLAFWIMSAMGYMAIKPMIKAITPNSLAAEAGLTAPQEVIAVDHQPAHDWTSVILPMVLRIGDPGNLEITTQQNNESKDYNIPLANWRLDPLKPNLLASLGIEPDLPKTANSPLIYEKRFSLVGSVTESYRLTKQFLWLNTVVIGKMLVGKISVQSLAGPLSLFQGALLSFKAGVAAFLGFLGFISIAIGFVNLLPIPGLDGAQILYLLIEKITRKPVSIPLQILAYRLGMIVLTILFIQVMMNDIVRYYGSNPKESTRAQHQTSTR